MATFKVDVYVDEQWVKTFYNVPADSEQLAIEWAHENLELDITAEEND